MGESDTSLSRFGQIVHKFRPFWANLTKVKTFWSNITTSLGHFGPIFTSLGRFGRCKNSNLPNFGVVDEVVLPGPSERSAVRQGEVALKKYPDKIEILW